MEKVKKSKVTRPYKYKLIDSIYESEVNNYLRKHPCLLKPANYVLMVSPTHYLYQLTYGQNLWYVHFDPVKDIIFKICVYKRCFKYVR